MNLTEFSALVAAYGGDENNWPAGVRAAAIQFRQENAAAAEACASAQLLDKALSGYEANLDVRALQARILREVAATHTERDLIDRIWQWLVPERIEPFALWRPALIATLPLVVGIVLGSNLPMPTDETADTWDDEIYLLALGDDGEATP